MQQWAFAAALVMLGAAGQAQERASFVAPEHREALIAAGHAYDAGTPLDTAALQRVCASDLMFECLFRLMLRGLKDDPKHEYDRNLRGTLSEILSVQGVDAISLDLAHEAAATISLKQMSLMFYRDLVGQLALAGRDEDAAMIYARMEALLPAARQEAEAEGWEEAPPIDFNMAYALAALGREDEMRALLVDLDPRGFDTGAIERMLGAARQQREGRAAPVSGRAAGQTDEDPAVRRALQKAREVDVADPQARFQAWLDVAEAARWEPAAYREAVDVLTPMWRDMPASFLASLDLDGKAIAVFAGGMNARAAYHWRGFQSDPYLRRVFVSDLTRLAGPLGRADQVRPLLDELRGDDGVGVGDMVEYYAAIGDIDTARDLITEGHGGHYQILQADMARARLMQHFVRDGQMGEAMELLADMRDVEGAYMALRYILRDMPADR